MVRADLVLIRLGPVRLAEEADEEADKEYRRLESMPFDFDSLLYMDDSANLANEHGVAYYHTMNNMRQGVLNMLAAGLHHFFEQQQRYFLSREPLPEGAKPVSMDKRLLAYGIDTSAFPCTRKLDELLITANALKHASDSANKELVAIRCAATIRSAIGKSS